MNWTSLFRSLRKITELICFIAVFTIYEGACNHRSLGPPNAINVFSLSIFLPPTSIVCRYCSPFHLTISPRWYLLFRSLAIFSQSLVCAICLLRKTAKTLVWLTLIEWMREREKASNHTRGWNEWREPGRFVRRADLVNYLRTLFAQTEAEWVK